MRAQPPNKRIVGHLFIPLLLTISLPSAFADTVHMKNGRTITVQSARVEGDEVVFIQAGNEMRIPKSLVEKIVADDETAVILPPPSREPTPRTPPTAGGTGSEDDAELDTEAIDGEEVDPESLREFWQQRVQAVFDEEAELEERLDYLRLEESAFLFSYTSTTETKRKIEAVQQRQVELEAELKTIRREARAKGIPVGWLRVRRGASES